MNQKTFEGHHQSSTTSYAQQDQNRQQVGRLNRTTPLTFALRINGRYYVSYKREQLWPMIIRSVLLAAFNIFLVTFISGFQGIAEFFKNMIEFGLIAQVILHILLCFMDAGTIFQDEQETYQEQRVYCVTCSLYRLRKSKHCIFCNKCVRNYDHHCSVFGKCIGRHNLVPFWLLIIITGIQFPAFIILLIMQAASAS